MLNNSPFNRWQNWWSDVAFLIVIGRLFQIYGAAPRKAGAADAVFVDETNKKALFEDHRDRAGI